MEINFFFDLCPIGHRTGIFDKPQILYMIDLLLPEGAVFLFIIYI